MNEPNLIKVLDHGYVRLVDHMGSDLSIARSARVSHNADWRQFDIEGGVQKDERLIHYLWKHQHTTPFESVVFTFEVKAPIFVIRQWHRHRTWSYNEVSARYTELDQEVYSPDFRLQSSTNKQGSSDEELDPYTVVKMHVQYDDVVRRAFALYNRLLRDGVAREVARCCLPVSTYTRMFATVNLLNLLKFFKLRSDSHAQYEIRVYSDAMHELIRPIVPVAMGAYALHLCHS